MFITYLVSVSASASVAMVLWKLDSYNCSVEESMMVCILLDRMPGCYAVVYVITVNISIMIVNPLVLSHIGDVVSSS